ncbi:MAG: NERD domain-containing protein [Chloroflexota bacterium]|nr:MAG: NERD domain-containing protein [Chloroflexota bacterium]
MHIIDNLKSEIIAGYDKIQSAENNLQSEWRDPLLSVYARQREYYEHELQQYQEIRAQFNRRLRLGIWMSSALLLLGLLVLPGLILINELGDFRGPLFCFAPLLILGGLTGWAIIVVLWIWQRDQVKPTPPQNPLKTDLFVPLIPTWKEALHGELPKKKPHPGATGEYHFITRLLTLTDDSLILYRLNLKPGEFVDVVLIGPKGIWVFDILFLKGLIRWRDGKWSQIQSSRRLSRKSPSTIEQVVQPFEQHWQTNADLVSEILRVHAPVFSAKSLEANTIRGGLVFTHPKGRYDIPPGCPFNWGIVSFWLDKLNSVPNQEYIDEYAMMEILNALLTRHQRLSNVQNLSSMYDYANSIISNSESRIQSWIRENEQILT